MIILKIPSLSYVWYLSAIEIIDTQVARRGRQYHRNPPPYKNRPTKTVLQKPSYKKEPYLQNKNTTTTTTTTATQPNPTQHTQPNTQHHHHPTKPNPHTTA